MYSREHFARSVAQNVRPQQNAEGYDLSAFKDRLVLRSLSMYVCDFAFETGVRPTKIFAPEGRLAHEVAIHAQNYWNHKYPHWQVPKSDPSTVEPGDRVLLLKLTANDGRRLVYDVEDIVNADAVPAGILSVIDPNLRHMGRTVADVAADLDVPYFRATGGNRLRRRYHRNRC